MQRWVTVSFNTQWYVSDIAVNILIATQLKAKQYYNGQHVIKSWVITELSTCHERISYWIISWTPHQSLVDHCHISCLENFEHVMNTSVIGSPLSLVICRTLNMSWTHQSLGHHCHGSHLQNFEHVIALAEQLWAHHCQSHTELIFLRTSLIYHQTLLHRPHISHEQNTIPCYEINSHADAISYHHLKDTTMIWKPTFLHHNPWLVTNCQSNNYTVTAMYQDTYRFIITRCRVIYRSNILSENCSIIACYIQVRTIKLAPRNIMQRW